MKFFATILFLCLLTTIDTDVYQALKSESLETLNNTLEKLEKKPKTSQNKAYTGVLTMKKAGLIKGAMKKLEMFKDGKEILETEINQHKDNVEYRFLRLSIQEYAPSILHYDDKIEEDKKYIIEKFHTLDKDLKLEIKEYTSTSSILKKEELPD